MAGNKGKEIFSKRKKQKSPNVEEANEDRLSSLPDFLILHILSFLETEEVVQTCVLSKRWKFIWTDISEINLTKDSYCPSNLFLNGVGRMLAMCNGTHLKRFAFSFCYSKCYASKLNFCVHLIVKHKVKDVYLCMDYVTSKYVLPQMLYLHSSMTSLYIRNCEIDPRGVIEWGSLKRLEIEEVELTDCVMEKVLSGSPVLELLNLNWVSGLTCLNISSPNLTTLEFESSEYPPQNGDYEFSPFLEILAPHLRVLTIKEDDITQRKRFRLKNISSLVRAEMYIYWKGDEDLDASPGMLSYMKDLLLSLRSVMDLHLGTWFTVVLSSLELKGWKVPISTRLSLTLYVVRHKANVPGILSILKSSPKLKTLVIRGTFGQDIDEEFISEDQVATYLKDHTLDIVMSHLKTIEFTGFTIEFLLSETMLILVELLLKSSNVLEKMIIREELVKSSLPGESTRLSEFALKLLTFPRASPTAVVMVC